MNSTQFATPQPQLCALLGISIEAVRDLRKKTAEGLHWIRDGNRVLFSLEGIAAMRSALHLPPAAAPLPDPAPAPERPPGEPPLRRGNLLGPPVASLTQLVVYRKVTNRQILEAHAPGTAAADRRNILRIRVPNNANFVPGMLVPVRFVQAPDLFECTRPMPRWKGKY